MFKKTKPEGKTEETVKESKANAKKATNAANKKAVKAAADKLITNMAADQPGAGASKRFLEAVGKLDKLEAEMAVLATAKRGIRGMLRGELKVDLSCLDRVRKLRKMEPEDALAKKTTEDLYEQQLDMDLTATQKKRLGNLSKNRDENKAAMVQAQGGETGSEVGSGSHIGSGVPEVNESLSIGGVGENVH